MIAWTLQLGVSLQFCLVKFFRGNSDILYHIDGAFCNSCFVQWIARGMPARPLNLLLLAFVDHETRKLIHASSQTDGILSLWPRIRSRPVAQMGGFASDPAGQSLGRQAGSASGTFSGWHAQSPRHQEGFQDRRALCLAGKCLSSSVLLTYRTGEVCRWPPHA